jgi:dTMP kinase
MSFIVIEGLDGSGKSTQIKLLKDYFHEKGISYHYLHFPRTDSPVYGELIARFLRGEMGNINAVDPYLVALIYAGDRDTAKHLIEGWLEKDSLVLADRYVVSNIAFQCAKLKTPEESEKLKKWILDLEYGFNRLPVPDMNIFLDVPFAFTAAQLEKTRSGEGREYLKGAVDIHESDLEFQEKVREIYLSIGSEIPGYKILDCSDGSERIQPPDKIFQNLIDLIQ